MAEQRYTYHGPFSGFTLIEGEGPDRTEREVLLSDGQAVKLPAEHPHVQALVAQRFLKPAGIEAIAAELDAMSKEELVAEAARYGVLVTRADGKEGEPLVSDYRNALRAISTEHA
jgi:hypothetical protein